MPKFDLEWAMYGRAVIEADDSDEAEQILHDGLSSFDTSMFEQFDVDSTKTTDVEPVEPEDD